MKPKLRVRRYELEMLGERNPEINYGELAHQALYFLEPLPRGYQVGPLRKAVKRAVRQALALKDPRFREDLPRAEVYLTKVLVKALSLQAVRPFFEEGVRVLREQEFQDASGETHRLDRLVFLPEGPVLLEFKLGAPRREHQDQVCLYQRVLGEILGSPPAAYLFYLDPPSLLEAGKIRQKFLL